VAPAVSRVAVNVRSATGGGLGDVVRGEVLLTPGAGLFSREVDVELTVPPAELPVQLVLHVGSAAVPVRVRGFTGAEDAKTFYARLSLDRPLALVRHDRGVLRDPGGQRVAAGFTVLDLDPPTLRRRGAARARAAELTVGLDPLAEVERRGAVTRRRLALLGLLDEADVLPTGLRSIAGLVVSDRTWRQWAEQLSADVDTYAKAAPLEPGLPFEAARRRLGVPDLALLPPLAAAAGLVTDNGRVRRPNAGPTFPPAVQRGLDQLRERLRAQPFAAPEAHELAAARLDAGVLAAAARAGLLLRLEGGIVLLPDVEDEAVRRLGTLPQPFTTSQARQALDTTRRVAIPLLEFLDARRRTRRLDNTRRTVVR
jgi:selenocysteine-specific elongation factor